ncbi:hypothetical protein [Scytonema hofmannii]|nr:hypothetical protein [Scytonema hofmannii]
MKCDNCESDRLGMGALGHRKRSLLVKLLPHVTSIMQRPKMKYYRED